MPKFDWDVKQGTAEWYQLRNGIPTASRFDEIIQPMKMKISERRYKYISQIVASRLLNWQADSLDNIEHIAEGKRKEPFAAQQLEMIQEETDPGFTTVPIGFARTDDLRFGASPDRAAGVAPDRARFNISVEIKSPTIPVQFEYLLFGHDDAYRPQIQGQLLVTEADKAIFFAYNDRTPAYRIETGRDDEFLGKLRGCLEQFSDELEAATARARSLGTYQAFDRLTDPAEAAYAGEALLQIAQTMEDEVLALNTIVGVRAWKEANRHNLWSLGPLLGDRIRDVASLHEAAMAASVP